MKIAIIGGGAAGMSAASRIKRLKPEFDVHVFEKSSFVSHAPCGIPFFVSGVVKNLDDLCAYDVAFFRNQRKINVHLNSEVVDVDYGYLEYCEAGERKKFEWDVLLFATGASPIKVFDSEKVYCVDSIEDAPRIRLVAEKSEKIVVIGSGYIGVEIVDSLTDMGKEVTVIEQRGYPLPEYDKEISEILLRKMKLYADVRMGEKVESIEEKGDKLAVNTNSGEYVADVVISAVGMKPNVELAKQLGVELGETGAIKTNRRMETSVENVYAAGDCAETINVVTGDYDWMPFAAPANKMGFVAGSNIAGVFLEFPGALKSQMTSFKDLEIGKVGLSEGEAVEKGYDVVSVTINSRNAAKYMPNGSITLKMIADRSGKVLGVQAIGKGVAKRIYAAASLLYKKARVEDFFFVDLPFYPPESPVWDPLVIAARNIMRAI